MNMHQNEIFVCDLKINKWINFQYPQTYKLNCMNNKISQKTRELK